MYNISYFASVLFLPKGICASLYASASISLKSYLEFLQLACSFSFKQKNYF